MMTEHDLFVQLSTSLSDGFGDHGLISIVILRRTGACLEIADWLMSCRVLTRGVEQFLMNRVVEIAREYELTRITGEYVPTPKNGMVKEFFAQFGFERLAEEDGRIR